MSARRWIVTDRFGNEIYLTDERWQHIVDGHPEMHDCEEVLKQAIRLGARRQEPLAPAKFRYTREVAGLPEGNTHVVAIVLFRFEEREDGSVRRNNYVVTAFQKQVGSL
ncbi:MAG TPA: hypothetical protein VFT45_16045 [Longimicrobium sp.]|nr:hypothetical protein [Longimicrobium sp.]